MLIEKSLSENIFAMAPRFSSTPLKVPKYRGSCNLNQTEYIPINTYRYHLNSKDPTLENIVLKLESIKTILEKNDLEIKDCRTHLMELRETSNNLQTCLDLQNGHLQWISNSFNCLSKEVNSMNLKHKELFNRYLKQFEKNT